LAFIYALLWFCIVFLTLALPHKHHLYQAAQLKNQILLAQRGNTAASSTSSSAARPAAAAASAPSRAPPATSSRGSAGGAKGGAKGRAADSEDEVDLEGSDLGSEDMDEEDMGDYVMFSGGEDEDDEDPYSTGA